MSARAVAGAHVCACVAQFCLVGIGSAGPFKNRNARHVGAAAVGKDATPLQHFFPPTFIHTFISISVTSLVMDSNVRVFMGD